MNNVFVYCEIEGTTVQEVSQELLTKGRKLADKLGVDLDAVVAGTGIKGKVEDQTLPYGVGHGDWPRPRSPRFLFADQWPHRRLYAVGDWRLRRQEDRQALF